MVMLFFLLWKLQKQMLPMKANEGNMRQYETKSSPGLDLLIFFLVAPYNQTSFIFFRLCLLTIENIWTLVFCL